MEAKTVYSTENVEQNKAMRDEVDRQDEADREEYNAYCDSMQEMLEKEPGYCACCGY